MIILFVLGAARILIAVPPAPGSHHQHSFPLLKSWQKEASGNVFRQYSEGEWGPVWNSPFRKSWTKILGQTWKVAWHFLFRIQRPNGLVAELSWGSILRWLRSERSSKRALELGAGATFKGIWLILMSSKIAWNWFGIRRHWQLLRRFSQMLTLPGIAGNFLELDGAGNF